MAIRHQTGDLPASKIDTLLDISKYEGEQDVNPNTVTTKPDYGKLCEYKAVSIMCSTVMKLIYFP